MAFCVKCGTKLTEGARFCSGCGASVDGAERDSVRKSVLDGEIHKCPNCGKELDSFTGVCICGYELRGVKSADSISNFVQRLEQIDQARKDETWGSWTKKMIGGRSGDSTIYKKIEMIKNYPIPNTKEDIYEFMILASSNINAPIAGASPTMGGLVGRVGKLLVGSRESASETEKSELREAWRVKLEQAYQKAKLMFGDTEIFEAIQSIYDEHSGKAKKKRWWKRR